jgi:hypothetical protein
MEPSVKLAEVIQKLNLGVRSAKTSPPEARRASLEREVTGGYVSDLLSDVLAHGDEGNLWITLQIHQNIVAVASMKNLAGIILVNGREPELEAIEKAETENVVIMVSEMPAFELVGRLYSLGITGMRR